MKTNHNFSKKCFNCISKATQILLRWNTKKNKKRFSLYNKNRIALNVQERKRKYDEEKKTPRDKQNNME